MNATDVESATTSIADRIRINDRNFSHRILISSSCFAILIPFVHRMPFPGPPMALESQTTASSNSE